ncbi:O-acetylhomoserine aminocarboxypropyltransferase/cysteine synthase [Halorubrum ezzemoulense]|uniref:O-acetylhomoserine aminocarboxypropyltransferase/cysteine synthase family protein n=1 Tax=Halorubrum ezzemoulense TaxID=337243 RepID=UPI000B9929B4|nr:O-acetylhomoserine aminocarboxypropyltransferase/cysteine synthase family protein [Halorubrum ezzemoulense]MDB9233915.1 O-acetylhomoserine aminocarboxypropyltransferase/cysteine synthase [Halorubrum ezzemoulense]MDB9280951.1 O-acetylhomoserine aminocarboxypropyltransferase/cysteine synthase [Halorubrum ezzemoulense]MDB9284468.1 O-acetylhomoserine aminocarboxypropyltransferase/cysteine synthase [Halorubrum ezzemoulense]OYR81517.1 O-acetyl-L-homoserine sulfhydrolase [Halorubrum ezzemoulense]
MTRGFSTRSLHAGAEPDAATGARATPIHQTTSYVFDDADTAAELYALRAEGHVYSRLSNPTVNVLEERLADLAGGSDAVATGSGMAAFDAITTVLASAGDNVVASSEMYGGTAAYLTSVADRRGIETRLVETLDYDAYADAIDDDTAFVHVETLANPSLVTPDFERLAEIAHENAVPLVVDNTFATPYCCRPFEHGADIVWESTTKWITGNGTTVGGVVIDGGQFPWDHPDADYAELDGESPAYPIDFVEQFGDAAFANVARQRGVRPTGGQQSPFDAWQTIQGLNTLPLRMDRHCENARRVAEFLRGDDRVDWVTYPGFEDHESHGNAAEYLDGFGGMVTFGVDGGYEAAKTFCESVDLTSFLANIGDAKTLVIHPASTTHAQMDEDEQRLAGVYPEMLRLSVGIEDPDDVIADLDAGLAAGEHVAAGRTEEERAADEGADR